METILVSEVLTKLAGEYDLSTSVLGAREGEFLFFSMLPLTEQRYAPLFQLDFTWNAFYTAEFFEALYSHILQTDAVEWFLEIMQLAIIETELLHLADEAIEALCNPVMAS